MRRRHIPRNLIQMEGEFSTASDLCRGRLSLLGMFFVLVFVLIGIRIVDLGIIQSDLVKFDLVMDDEPVVPVTEKYADVKADVRRGNIYDRNGVLLASTIKTPSLYADPLLILEPEKVAHDLVKIFPDLKFQKVLGDLRSTKRFSWVKRNISPAQQERILELGQPGLGVDYGYQRIYPLGAMSAHLLGYTDLDGKGLAGIERTQNDVLALGKPVTLTLDVRLQHVAAREVARAIKEFNAQAGAGIVMDVQTGEVLAGVSLPDFDLNFASDYASEPEKNKDHLFNRLSLGVYELGSMFKIFSTSVFFETQKDALSAAFDVREPIKIGRFKIDDYKGKDRILSAPEVFIYSSNIGTASMARIVGADTMQKYYRDLGLLDPMKTDIAEIGKPSAPPAPWHEVSLLTASYGHGVSTTPMQMAAAVGTVVNGGYSVTPRIVKHDDEAETKRVIRVLSDDTSAMMRKMLRLVVTQGTGSKSDVPGYAIGGKTGTAEKIVNGRYVNGKLISSFVGAFPMNDPRYVVMVMVDEPKGNKQSHGYATAGWVAAPAVGRIVSSMASILGLPADQYNPERDVSLDLMPYVQESYDGKKNLNARAISPRRVVNKPEGVQRVSY